MAPRPRHTSRSRRRSRRAHERLPDLTAGAPFLAPAVEQLAPELQERLDAVVAAASGSTSLPLSDQGDPWDAGAAAKSLTDAQIPQAFFWTDPDGDPKTLAGHKLQFAENRSGTLTAVWRGVTAAAGAVQGARGGVDIPSGDVAGVKTKIGSYYAKAAKQYDDDNIKPPWAASAGQSAAFLLAYAECGALSGLDLQFNTDGVLVGVGGSGEGMDQFLAVLAHWQEALGEGELGGKPSEGTDKDKRLKANKPAASAERDALEAIREALAAPEEEGVVLPFARIVPAFGVAETTEEGVTVPIDIKVIPREGSFPEGDAGVTLGQAFDQLRVHLENFELVLPVEAEELPAPNGPQPVVTPPAVGGTGELRWVANIVPEATLTDDGRAMAPGALTWRELPLTLMAMVETSEGGHVGAEVAGRIDEIYRDGNMLKATGVFAATEYGQMIGGLVGDGTLRGVSVDLAIHQYEVGPRSDYFDEDGNWLTERPVQPEDEESPSLIDLLFGDEAEDSIFVVTDAVIGAVTVCPFQAFADATISLAASGNPAVWTISQQAGYVVTSHESSEAFDTITLEPGTTLTYEPALTASAAGLAPEAPPASWFDDPELDELTPLTVDEEGRIFGHAAAWDTCHLGIPDVCTTAPSTETNYAYFLLKEVLCADGERIPCGTITLETGHADRSLGRGDATAHYDNTGLAVADVNVGEDEHGIWVAGALRSDVDAEKARELRGAVLSGDWRSVNGNLELVALLAVNVPGFPVPRARALVAAGDEGNEVLALVAAGITLGRAPNGGKGELISPIQAEKLQLAEAIASGRVRSLAARALGVEGVLTADSEGPSHGETGAPPETEDEPAPLAPSPPPGVEEDEPADEEE